METNMMQSTSEGCMNIAELANHLRREKIFINSERQLLQKLNEEVEKRALELLQASWICSMQRQNLTNLITSRCEADSIASCQRTSQLERTTFVDVFKVLKFKVRILCYLYHQTVIHHYRECYCLNWHYPCN